MPGAFNAWTRDVDCTTSPTQRFRGRKITRLHTRGPLARASITRPHDGEQRQRRHGLNGVAQPSRIVAWSGARGPTSIHEERQAARLRQP